MEKINKSAEKFISEMVDTNLIPKTIDSINSQLEAKSEEIGSISAKDEQFKRAVESLEAQLNKDTLMWAFFGLACSIIIWPADS